MEDNFSLPKTMITEVLGSQKAIAFCEGDNKNSIDYRIYRSLLGEKYTVIPVGGHLNVINYCDVLSNSDWIGRQCIGIVDGDNFTEEKIENLTEQNIIVLPFNEIEMLLLSDLVMEHTMRTIRPFDADKRILAFKEKFWDKISKEKEKIILTATKNAVDEYVKKEKIQEYDSLESIKDGILHIVNCDVESIYNGFFEDITKVIEGKDYNKMLRICNLKKEISKGIANMSLDSDYEEKAIQQIVSNIDLQKKLVEQYFRSVLS